MLSTGFKLRLNQLWDRLFTEGISNPVTATEQISYLFYLKWLEVVADYENGPFGPQNYGYPVGPRWKPQLPDNMRWSHIRQMPDEAKIEYMAAVVFPWLKDESQTSHPYSRLMNDSVFIIFRPSLLVEVMDVVEATFSIEAKTEKIFWEELNSGYCLLLDKLPLSEINDSVNVHGFGDLINSLVMPNYNDNVMDPACKTGGLLSVVADRIISFNTDGVIGHARIDAAINGFGQGSSFARMTMMNLMLQGVFEPSIKAEYPLANYPDERKFSLVVSAPPVMAINNKEMQGSSLIGGERMELRYIERIVMMLNIGGRSAIIIPAGILANQDYINVNLWTRLLQTCRVEAVISFPKIFLKKYDTDMAIIYFFKEKEWESTVTKDTDYATQNLWMYEVASDDYQAITTAYFDKATHLPNTGFIVPLQNIIENNFSLDVSLYRNAILTPQVSDISKNVTAVDKVYISSESAQEHPYYQLLYAACEISNLPDNTKINLLSIVSANKIKEEFTIQELLSKVRLFIDKNLVDEEILTQELNKSLLRFIGNSQAAFTFKMLEKVLAQLQFLPAFPVLSKAIFNGLNEDVLRQVYIGKEQNVNKTNENNLFELFYTLPGHLHLVHANSFHHFKTIVQ